MLDFEVRIFLLKQQPNPFSDHQDNKLMDAKKKHDTKKK